MELFEPLPRHLKGTGNSNITHGIHQQLSYLWKACHEVAATSLPLSHRLSKSFIDLVRQHGVIIPENVEQRFCAWCSCIQLPSITSSVRISTCKKRKFTSIEDDMKGSFITVVVRNTVKWRVTFLTNIFVTHSETAL